MSKCYLDVRNSVRTHMLDRSGACTVCGKTICSECIGWHLPTGAVWCVRCASVSLGDDRLAQFTYRPGKSGIHHLSTAQKSSFHQTRDASAVQRFWLSFFGCPERQSANLNHYRFDLTFANSSMTRSSLVPYSCWWS